MAPGSRSDEAEADLRNVENIESAGGRARGRADCKIDSREANKEELCIPKNRSYMTRNTELCIRKIALT